MNNLEILKKWSAMPGKMGIGDVEDKYIKESLSKVLENQETQYGLLMNESQGLNTYSSVDGTNSGGASGKASQFAPVSLALVRRTFPDLFAHNIVGVQPMNGPVGLAYALRFLYDGIDPDTEMAWKDVEAQKGFAGPETTTEGEDKQIGASTPNTYPQGKLVIDKKAFEATTRKLGASYSLEVAQDLRAMHGIEIEREMLNVLQYEMTAELDRGIVAEVGTLADTNSTTVSLSAADARWSQERFAVIANEIINAANKIALATKRGAGNFVVVNSRIATALQALSNNQFTANTNVINATSTMANIGTLNGTITVYRDSYSLADEAIIGYKGAGVSDAGVIYMPYITGLVSQATAQEDFTPRIGVMSRSAIVTNLLGAGNYYNKVVFSGLAAYLS